MAPGEKVPRESQEGREERPLVAKRPWQPPRLRTGHLFESNSLSCGKNSGNDEQCVQNPTTS